MSQVANIRMVRGESSQLDFSQLTIWAPNYESGKLSENIFDENIIFGSEKIKMQKRSLVTSAIKALDDALGLKPDSKSFGTCDIMKNGKLFWESKKLKTCLVQRL